MMAFNEKIEIMMNRKRIRKVDFADRCGITYRALANYMTGARKPRAEVLSRMADVLDTTVDFLLNDEDEIELTPEERFVKRSCRTGEQRRSAVQFLEETRGLFAGNSLSDGDKDALFACLFEIYEDSRK